jgi:chromosome segregation ATPase
MMELELLKQENAELRKEVSAQTSMLTSRNREKERLYQEIEELKLGSRRDGSRSVAGDSILDRSVSRAQMRPSSEHSDGTGSHGYMDRDELEARNGQLRDQLSTLKLENQAIRAQLNDYVSELEELDKAYQADVDQAEEEMQNLSQERDQAMQERDEAMQEREQAMQMADERDAAFQDLRAEAQEELDALGEELDQKIVECQRMNEDLRNQDESLKVLQAEMRSASEGIIRLEEDAQNNLERYKAVQQELEETNREMEELEKSLFEANTKVQRLTVQIESSQNEIAFLREEQDGDKIRIGDLESELKTYRMSLHSEKEKTRELEQRLADERHQREVVGSKEKQEVQRIMNELNREASAAKEEVRRLKKSLSTQEIETTTWRERLMDLENNLRETLGDLSGSRSSLISNIMKLQKELESTALELESVRQQFDEKDSLLRNRDALLESHGLESRKLSELLERERQARRADKQSFEQSLKSHQQASRTITHNNSRITDLENARNQDRKRFTALEQQFRDQLSERNTMFLTIWKRLSSICGPDWAHSNSLINGNLPSQEVIGNILFWPGFSRNLLLAIKTVEGVISGFKSRVKSIEHDLTKQYSNLEHSFHQRARRLERVEETVKNLRAGRGHSSSSSSEAAKLRGENRLLKAEINLLQSNSRTPGSASAAAAAVVSPRSPSLGSAENAERSLAHHNSTSGSGDRSRSERTLTRSSTGLPQPSHTSSTSTLTNNAGAMTHRSRSGTATWEGTDDKWIYRLHELEKRLKAEREGRLLDRSGARKRLEERDAENQRLRDQLVRERTRRGPSGNITQPPHGHVPTSDEGQTSSEGEGITVDIEV